jgi:hypothetical protein
MPIAKIHVADGRFDEARLEKVSQTIQAALTFSYQGVPLSWPTPSAGK